LCCDYRRGVGRLARQLSEAAFRFSTYVRAAAAPCEVEMGLGSRPLYGLIFSTLLLALYSSAAKGQDPSRAEALDETAAASGVTANHVGFCTGPSWARCGPKQLCRNLAVDSFNCGSCGTFCGLGGFCRYGTCTCKKLGLTFCPGTGCRSTSNDPASCGACGRACVAGQTCVNGQCGCKSKPFNFLPGQALCPVSRFQRSCVNIGSDNKNCGRCGKVCSAGLTCCAGLCTNTTTNTNCGACGRACSNGIECSSTGVCCNDVGGTCGTAADCCGSNSCEGTCCSELGGDCQGDTDCCGTNTCQSGTCAVPCIASGDFCSNPPVDTECCDYPAEDCRGGPPRCI